MNIINILVSILVFISLPLLAGGIIRKIRARSQGRKGPPILQNIYDIRRLLVKTPIDGPYSGFFAENAPIVSLVASVVIWSIIAFEWAPFILIPFFLALMRISITGYAMETGTSFGGLGTGREMLLSITSEPIIFLMILVAQSQLQLTFSLPAVIMGVLFLGASGIAIMAELAKPPFDDPRTHLELTMVHEAMLLESSGRSLGFFDLGQQFKIAALLGFLVRLGLDHSKFLDPGLLTPIALNLILFAGTCFIAVIVGYWEAVSVRRKWSWVPEIMGLTFLFILLLGTLVKLN
ncbi:MAG: NADH-quinone oxidoreductase subunit H [Leptospira sp.]|nr:NADH-quinone oxidoreductase subunit H [Leptospira sp.]